MSWIEPTWRNGRWLVGRPGDGARARPPSATVGIIVRVGPSWLAVVSRPSSLPSRGHSTSSARSARNISRACSSSAPSAESSSGECWRIRLDWYSSSEALVLLALGDVGAVGQEHRDQRHDQQDQQRGLDPQIATASSARLVFATATRLAELDHLERASGTAGRRPTARCASRWSASSARRRAPSPANAATHAWRPGSATGPRSRVEHGHRGGPRRT